MLLLDVNVRVLLGLCWFSLKLVLIDDDSRDVELDVGGGFRITGPILLPLLELLEAGTRLPNGRFVDVDEFCKTSGFFAKLDVAVTAVDGFNGIFFTVFVETALFKEERELLKLLLELLRSTLRKRLLVGVAGTVCDSVFGRLREFTRRGVVVKLRSAGAGCLIERLLSRD